jgi:starch synthase (maltosyl-transferring)
VGELKSVVEFWIAQGVRIFRVDNPHTKSFAFWEWVIAEIKRDHPEVIFLAEAFTGPEGDASAGETRLYAVVHLFHLAQHQAELTEYFTELSAARAASTSAQCVAEYAGHPARALQSGLRAVFAARLVLAATLSANYGIYGPTYELMESAPREPGSEEYRDSEKYQLRIGTSTGPTACGPDRAHEPHSPREPGAAVDRSLSFCTIDNRS